MLESEVEKLIVQYKDELITPGLTLFSQQERFSSGRTDLIFVNKNDELIVVEIKTGSIRREHLGQLIEYWPQVKEKYPDRNVRLMVIANDIPYEKRAYLEQFDILFKEIPEDILMRLGKKQIIRNNYTKDVDKNLHLPPKKNPIFSSATYKMLNTVTNGLHTLALKFREDLDPPYYCLTLRTKRPKSKSNRRFYYEKEDGFWKIPIDVAIQMLEEAHARGLMSSLYHRWPKAQHSIIDSFSLPSSARRTLFRELLVVGNEDQIWEQASDTRIINFIEPWSEEVWRKAMIFSVSLGIVTFRSLTKRIDYKHAYNHDLYNGWKIDRSMMDADGVAFQSFYKALVKT